MGLELVGWGWSGVVCAGEVWGWWVDDGQWWVVHLGLGLVGWGWWVGVGWSRVCESEGLGLGGLVVGRFGVGALGLVGRGLCVSVWGVVGWGWSVLVCAFGFGRLVGWGWPILGLCWPILGAMLAHLGAMLAHLGGLCCTGLRLGGPIFGVGGVGLVSDGLCFWVGRW